MAAYGSQSQRRSHIPAAPPIAAIVMGGSAGALQPMLQVVQALPWTLAQPLIIVLHLPERGEGNLPEVFAHYTDRVVLEAQDKQKLQPHTVHVAAASYHLAVERDRSLSLCDELPMNFSRPSIDVLFRSAAAVFGRQLVAVLFSGASNDGAEGLDAVWRAGGMGVVQAPEDAAFPTMPRAAIALQSRHRILSCAQMPAFLTTLAGAQS